MPRKCDLCPSDTALFMMWDSMSADVQEFLLVERTGMRMQQAQSQADRGMISDSGAGGEEFLGRIENSS